MKKLYYNLFQNLLNAPRRLSLAHQSVSRVDNEFGNYLWGFYPGLVPFLFVNALERPVCGYLFNGLNGYDVTEKKQKWVLLFNEGSNTLYLLYRNKLIFFSIKSKYGRDKPGRAILTFLKSRVGLRFAILTFLKSGVGSRFTIPKSGWNSPDKLGFLSRLIPTFLFNLLKFSRQKSG